MDLENFVNENNQGLEPVDNSAARAIMQQGLDSIEKLKNEPLPEDNIHTTDGRVRHPKEEEEAATLVEEEVEDEGSEEEGEEEENTEEQALEDTKTKDKKTSKYRKLQNDKYRLRAEKIAAEERIRELEGMLNESVSTGTYHYGKNVYAELDHAKSLKKQAIAQNDEDAFIEADILINKALIKVNELEKWAENDNSYRAPAPVSNVDVRVKQETANDWLDSHPELRPNSRRYNPDLATQVAEYSNYLDEELHRKGQMDIHYSPEYFDAIDEYIESLHTKPVKAPIKHTNREVESLPAVGGVRNSYVPSTRKSSKAKITLTPFDKNFCLNTGMSEEHYIQYKLGKK